MKKAKAKTSAQKRRAKTKAKAKTEEQKRGNWVQDRLDWVRVVDYHDHEFDHDVGTEDKAQCSHSDDNCHDNGPHIFSNDIDDSLNHQEGCSGQSEHHIPHDDVTIISWNVLADSYCSRSSHKNLPSKFQSQVFNRNQRQHHVRQILRLFETKLSPDLVALQEVDPPLEGTIVRFFNNDWRADRNSIYCSFSRFSSIKSRTGQRNAIISYAITYHPDKHFLYTHHVLLLLNL